MFPSLALTVAASYMNAFSPLAGFRSEKAAQIAAYIIKAHKGHMEKLALIKMIYIGERESIRSRGRPMIYDELYSLKDGPICKSALDGINGHIDEKVWEKYIILQGDRDVYSVRGGAEDLDQLSRSDFKILDLVIARHQGWSSSQLRNWLHDSRNCSEYVEVFGKQRAPIEYGELALAVGIENPIDVEHEIKAYRASESLIPRS
ncbi:Panacea domain-containing protein [Methylobacterium sp. ap11]|uniref:type II toxin-antitoxin system antitoxin SocA domain-containing protein n=1 Tax=Methylobacterium sp. ap11 TaxID=1761799 RepID=UPI001160C997|nr:Panacea domain-containing protein [Methylobacterium sp. ap11]